MEDANEKSMFNAGIAKLQRIDKARQAFQNARIADNLNNQFDCCELWWLEMEYNSNKDEREESERLSNSITTMLNSKNSDYFNTAKTIKNYYIHLGRIEHRLGLGMPDQANPFDAATK